MNNQQVYEIVTNKIIETMEKGEIPWEKPWASGGKLPKNFSTGANYHGINMWSLALKDYSSPFWMSYKQAKDLGGQVKHGEKGSQIIFFKMLENDNGDEFPLARYSTVFNLEQIDGIKNPDEETKVNTFSPIENAEKISSNYKIEIRHEKNCAAYIPTFNYINMPQRNKFTSSEEWYSTLFHEFGHSTGHESKLNRNLSCLFGSHAYSKEELIAELCSAFLCNTAGILAPVIENQAAYISNWLKILKNDRKFLVSAASQAGKAANLILGLAV